jgi:DNA polymerase-3 subunit delta'
VSRTPKDDAEATPHPRETLGFIGHPAAEQALLEAYRSGRVPHAWLLGGPLGVGKATLAYRFARFVLANPDPEADPVQRASSLEVAHNHGVTRRIAAQGHPDLLVLCRTLNEKGKLRTVITVDDVRRTIPFFGSTAGEGGWRVCIVDTADELQHPQAANALLKALEEPPSRSLFLLIANAPGRLLPTIRSRCRRLTLGRLDETSLVQLATSISGRAGNDPALVAAAAAAEGSVGRALMLLDGATLALRERVATLLERLPEVDPRALHTLGEEIAGTDPEPLAAFTETVRAWLSARLGDPAVGLAQLARVAEVWDKVQLAARETETYNLERKPLVFSVFGLLAETARR